MHAQLRGPTKDGEKHEVVPLLLSIPPYVLATSLPNWYDRLEFLQLVSPIHVITVLSC